MHRTVAASAVTLALMAAPGAQTPESGAIAGHVVLRSRIAGAALPGTAYPTRTVSAHRVESIPEIRNVVVYLKNPGWRGLLPAGRASIVQEHETFVPHVLAVTLGSVVDFPNADPIYHNVFSLSSAGTFNLGRFPRGESRAQPLVKTGVVKVYCQIHSHMSATMMIFNHPWFAIPDEKGTFDLSGVPPGDHQITAWHEGLGDTTLQIHVDPGRAAEIDFVLPVPAQP